MDRPLPAGRAGARPGAAPIDCLARCLAAFVLLAACGGPAAQPAPRFDLLEFAVQGNSVLGTEAIERAVYPFLGEQRSVDDVQSARAALEQAYRDAGYGSVGVDIPEQRVTDGVVRLQVVESRISRTRVTGSRYYSQGYILDKVPGAAEGQVPHFPTLQAELGIVNRTADRRVSPLLRPGREPGTTELDLVVEDRLPVHGSVELNNRASPNTSSTRLVASLRHDNILQRDHSAGLLVQVSPEQTEEVKVLSATYTMPMGQVGQDSLLFSFTRSDSQVAAGVADTTVFGKGSIWGLRYNRAVMLGAGAYHLATVGVDSQDFDETIEAGHEAGFATPIRYLPLFAGYLAIVDDEPGRWQFGGSLGAGIRGLVNTEEEFANKRFGANGTYLLVKGDASREQRLGGGGLVLRAKAEAQLTADPLISNEQFVVGGVDSVRGYLEAAAVGDIGLRASVELRSPEMARESWPLLGGLSVHAFLDGAATELRQPLPDQQSRFRLLGAGFGARLKATPLGSLSLDVGWPLKRLGETARGDLRVHAAGALEF